MRIVTWNMNAAFRGEGHSGSWDWLVERLQPDVVLAQEAIKPDTLTGHGALVGPLGSRYGWGSWVAVFGDSVSLEPMLRLPLGEYIPPPALADSHPGSCAVATIALPNGERLVAASIYGLMDNTGNGRIRHATTTLHRILSDLMPVFEGRLPIVLGGDLNITTQPMKGDFGGWWHAQHEVLFRRLDALGMVNVTDLDVFDRGEGAPGCTCGQDAACRHIRTIRHFNHPDSTPYQDDWLFVSKTLEARVIGGRVVHNEEAWQRSDHCPLVVDLDL